MENINKFPKKSIVQDYSNCKKVVIMMLYNIVILSSILISCEKYENDSKHMELNPIDIKNLQQTKWVALYADIGGGIISPFVDSAYLFPAILEFNANDYFHGKSDANSFDGNYYIDIDANKITFTKISSTDGCPDDWWYWDYFYSNLYKFNKVAPIGTDTLILINSDEKSIFYFLSKEWFEKNYYNLPY